MTPDDIMRLTVGPRPTEAQAAAIAEQLARYTDGVPRLTWWPWDGMDSIEATIEHGALEVEFGYIRGEEPEVLGLERTVFAIDGIVLTSQDYG